MCTGETWGNLETAGSGEIVRVQGAERERSLKTVESGEVDLCAGGARGDWKPYNLGRHSSVQWKPGQSENRGSLGRDLCGFTVGGWGWVEPRGSDEADGGGDTGKHRSVEKVVVWSGGHDETPFRVGLS